MVCKTEGNWSRNELRVLLKRAFGEDLRVVNPKDRVDSIALTTGSGASLMESMGAECFLTGDIKYHDAMRAKAIDLMIVDIGHFQSEKFLPSCSVEDLEKFANFGYNFPNHKKPVLEIFKVGFLKTFPIQRIDLNRHLRRASILCKVAKTWTGFQSHRIGKRQAKKGLMSRKESCGNVKEGWRTSENC